MLVTFSLANTEAICGKSGKDNISTNIMGAFTSCGSEDVVVSMVSAIDQAMDDANTIQLLD